MTRLKTLYFPTHRPSPENFAAGRSVDLLGCFQLEARVLCCDGQAAPAGDGATWPERRLQR